MTEKILFFFSALGVFNALILVVYFSLFKSKKSSFDYCISILLFLMVIRVGVSCFYFFGPLPKSLIKLGLVANLFLGPSMLWILQSSKSANLRFQFTNLLLPVIFVVLLIPSWILFDFRIWDWRIRFIIHFVLTLYLVFCGIKWRKEILGWWQNKIQSTHLKKGVIVYLSLLAVCLGFAVALFTTYILGPLVFSIIFYFCFGYFLQANRKRKKYQQHSKIDQVEFQKINEKLMNLMEIEAVYRNPDLNLEALAHQLGVSKHRLSQFLNHNLQKTFHQYINDYRINEACQLLKENKPFSIEAIGHEVGFHSRSSFFSAFKKLKGVTPSKFKAKIKV